MNGQCLCTTVKCPVPYPTLTNIIVRYARSLVPQHQIQPLYLAKEQSVNKISSLI